MKELLGKKIKEIYVNEDQSMLKFACEDGEFLFSAEGDCCSESWFADIVFGWTSKFFNNEVIGVEQLEVPEWVNELASKDGRTRQEYDEVYGFKVVTNQTHCDIIFRTSSNGYYGGWCEFVKGEPYSNWWKEKLDKSEWEQITDDWRV